MKLRCPKKVKSTTLLVGKTAIVTGANGGIGEEVSGELARRGCRVILACRDLNKANKTKNNILQKYGDDRYKNHQINDASLQDKYMKIDEERLIPMHLDLMSLERVVNFVKEYKSQFSQLDLLVCNASTPLIPEYKESVDGFEMHMALYLGHVLLIELLMETLEASEEPRIVYNTCSKHAKTIDIKNFISKEKKFSPNTSYKESKLASIIFMKHLGLKPPRSKVLAYSADPGLVSHQITSKMFKTSFPFMVLGTWDGSQQTLSCLLDPRESLINGALYRQNNTNKIPDICKDIYKVDKFAENTLELLKNHPSCKEHLPDF